MREYDMVQATATAMQRRGDGFVKALGTALTLADPDNRRKIHEAFPEYLEQYRKIAKNHNWYLNE